MSEEELKILERTLNWANEYFTNFCMVTNTKILSQEEIDKIEDEIERENAQEYRYYEDLLNMAFSIINKYKEKKRGNKK